MFRTVPRGVRCSGASVSAVVSDMVATFCAAVRGSATNDGNGAMRSSPVAVVVVVDAADEESASDGTTERTNSRTAGLWSAEGAAAAAAVAEVVMAELEFNSLDECFRPEPCLRPLPLRGVVGSELLSREPRGVVCPSPLLLLPPLPRGVLDPERCFLVLLPPPPPLASSVVSAKRRRLGAGSERISGLAPSSAAPLLPRRPPRRLERFSRGDTITSSPLEFSTEPGGSAAPPVPASAARSPSPSWSSSSRPSMLLLRLRSSFGAGSVSVGSRSSASGHEVTTRERSALMALCTGEPDELSSIVSAREPGTGMASEDDELLLLERNSDAVEPSRLVFPERRGRPSALDLLGTEGDELDEADAWLRNELFLRRSSGRTLALPTELASVGSAELLLASPSTLEYERLELKPGGKSRSSECERECE